LNNNIPSLFISYSHDNELHKEWTYKLAYDLRVNGGIDVLLDQWSVRLGNSLQAFMQNDLGKSRMVLCICTEGYYVRSQSSESGVSEELRVLKEKIQANKDAEIDHIIPVIKNNAKRELPDILEGYKLRYINAEELTYEELFYELINRIWDEDLKKVPPIGKNPFANNYSTKLDEKLLSHNILYQNPNFEATVDFNYLNNDGEFIIGRGEYLFTTAWSNRGSGSIYAYSDPSDIKRIAHDPKVNCMPQTIEQIMETYDSSSFSSRTRPPKIGEFVIWENVHGNFAATKIEDVVIDEQNNVFKLKFSYKVFEK